MRRRCSPYALGKRRRMPNSRLGRALPRVTARERPSFLVNRKYLALHPLGTIPSTHLLPATAGRSRSRTRVSSLYSTAGKGRSFCTHLRTSLNVIKKSIDFQNTDRTLVGGSNLFERQCHDVQTIEPQRGYSHPRSRIQ